MILVYLGHVYISHSYPIHMWQCGTWHIWPSNSIPSPWTCPASLGARDFGWDPAATCHQPCIVKSARMENRKGMEIWWKNGWNMLKPQTRWLFHTEKALTNHENPPLPPGHLRWRSGSPSPRPARRFLWFEVFGHLDVRQGRGQIKEPVAGPRGPLGAQGAQPLLRSGREVEMSKFSPGRPSGNPQFQRIHFLYQIGHKLEVYPVSSGTPISYQVI